MSAFQEACARQHSVRTKFEVIQRSILKVHYLSAILPIAYLVYGHLRQRVNGGGGALRIDRRNGKARKKKGTSTHGVDGLGATNVYAEI